MILDLAAVALTALLSEVVCGTAVDLMSDDPLETDFNGQPVRMIRVTETKAGYAIGYGSRSTMIRIGITKQMRENIRSA